MALLDPQTWSGSIFSGGWREAAGGDQPVTEPAAGSELERVGSASPGRRGRCVRASGVGAGGVVGGASDERAAVLRRAAACWRATPRRSQDWIVRESGAIPPKAAARDRTSPRRSATRRPRWPRRPAGEMLPTAKSRGCRFARRVPVGVVGVISPFNFPLILSIRSVAPALALGNAVVLKPDPRTAVCGGSPWRASSRRPGCPRRAARAARRRRRGRRRWSTDPRVRGHLLHRLHGGGPQGRRGGRAPPQARPPRARRQLGADRARRRRPRPRCRAGAFGLVLPPGPDLHDDRPAPGPRDVADEYVERLAAKADAPAGRRPGTASRSRSARSSTTSQLRPDPRAGDASVDARRHGWPRAATYDDLFYRPTVLAGRRRPHARVAEEVFGPVAPVALFTTADEAVDLARPTPTTACRSASSPGT